MADNVGIARIAVDEATRLCKRGGDHAAMYPALEVAQKALHGATITNDDITWLAPLVQEQLRALLTD